MTAHSKVPGALLERRKRAKRIMIWSLLVIVLGSMLLPFTGHLLVSDGGEAVAQQQLPEPQRQAEGENLRSDYWKAVRRGTEGYSAVKGPEANVLVQNGGEIWREIRNGPLASIAPWLLAGIVGLIILFHSIHGPSRVEEPLSGRTVPRWNLGERVMHWYTAILFVILAITGLSILFGRNVLIPIMGYEGFAAYANLAKVLHNYLGPFFIIGVVAEIIVWVRNNIPKGYDWEWLKKGGPLASSHVRSGKVNAGEKIWFWLIVVFGIIVSVTGVILDFPIWGQTRGDMQLANVIHIIGGVLWTCVALGHIYLGTLGTPGAWEGMTSGRVSSEWAKHHHDLWYEDVKDKEETREAAAGAPKSGAARPAG